MDVLDDVGLTDSAPLPSAIDHDRCESCPQLARLWAEVNGTTIAYCSHHGTRFYDRLIMTGRILLDTRHELG